MCEKAKAAYDEGITAYIFQHYLEDRNLNATLAMLSDQLSVSVPVNRKLPKTKKS